MTRPIAFCIHGRKTHLCTFCVDELVLHMELDQVHIEQMRLRLENDSLKSACEILRAELAALRERCGN